MTPTGAVMVTLSAEEFQRAIAAAIAPLREQLAALAETQSAVVGVPATLPVSSEPPGPKRRRPSRPADPELMTSREGALRYGYSTPHCFIEAARRWGVVPIAAGKTRLLWRRIDVEVALRTQQQQPTGRVRAA